MSEEKKPYDGRQAFPRAGYDGPKAAASSVSGMTLREWFAGMAMQGLLSNESLNPLLPPDISRMAFEQADSMLAESEKWK